MVVSNIFYFHLYLGKISSLTNIFQMGWFNHQPVVIPSPTMNTHLGWSIHQMNKTLRWPRGVDAVVTHMCHGQKSRFIGDGKNPTVNRNPFNGAL